jgi:hypothetical protein
MSSACWSRVCKHKDVLKAIKSKAAVFLVFSFQPVSFNHQIIQTINHFSLTALSNHPDAGID